MELDDYLPKFTDDEVSALFRLILADDEPQPDALLLLASVKTHLADQQPMDEGDIQAWRICHALQEQVVSDGR